MLEKIFDIKKIFSFMLSNVERGFADLVSYHWQILQIQIVANVQAISKLGCSIMK
jgi:hypothetical protein